MAREAEPEPKSTSLAEALALALVRLGRVGEAAPVIETLLARDHDGVYMPELKAVIGK